MAVPTADPTVDPTAGPTVALNRDSPAVRGEPRPKLIVGLGNPGEPYRNTRHNVGFGVLDEIARRRQWRLKEEQCSSRIAANETLVLAQPQTYMNRSGYAVRCLAELRGFEPSDMLVVFDDLHLPLGKLRLRRRGGPGGHRGLESIIESLHSQEIPRLRLGIAPPSEAGDEPLEAPPGGDLADFVLARFADHEMATVKTMTLAAADACELWLAEGVEAAMNSFNR